MKEERKIFGRVFDKPTYMALYRLSNKGIFERLGGEVATGKEAKVFIAYNDEPLAVKIYRVDAAAFESIWPYIRGDPRFAGIGKNRRLVIYTWVRKEFRNLKRMFDAGVNVPKPYAFDSNVLVMQFIGDNVPAPKLKDVDAGEELFWKIFGNIKTMYQVAKLVHADLSEYNILVWHDEPYIIDVGQAVDIKHPMALQFLERDIKNLVKFFEIDADIDALIKEVADV